MPGPVAAREAGLATWRKRKGRRNLTRVFRAGQELAHRTLGLPEISLRCGARSVDRVERARYRPLSNSRASPLPWRDSPESEASKQEVRTYEFPVQPDGSFRVEDVLSGGYKMQVRAHAPVRPDQSPAAKAEIEIEVPDGSPSDAPLDVGILTPIRARF